MKGLCLRFSMSNVAPDTCKQKKLNHTIYRFLNLAVEYHHWVKCDLGAQSGPGKYLITLNFALRHPY